MSRKWLLLGLASCGLLVELSPFHVGTSLGQVVEEVPPIAVDWRVLPSPRGRILDRNGAPLADVRAALDIYVVPRLFTAEVRARLVDLMALSEAETAELDGRVAGAAVGPPGRAVLVLEDQERGRAELVARARLELGGAVEVKEDPVRVYPRGQLASHLVGYMGPFASAGLSGPEDARRAPDVVGQYGLEKAAESSLRGSDGVERFIVGGSGERMPDGVTEALIGGPTLEPPIAGHDVVLTLDLELQELAEKSARKHPAAAVVLAEVETGRILALVSTPSFDPAAMSRDHAGAERERLDSDPRRPHLDRTLGASFPPASTFKLITAIAGLEDGLASPDEKLTCTGQRTEGKRVLRDMQVHGTIDFSGALQVSCNIYFWKIAERVGIARMVEVARDLGLGEPTGMGVNGDVPGQLPDGPLAAAQAARDLVPTLNAAIGAGDVKATPVQLAMAYAAVANGGRLYAPQVVLRVQAASGEVVEAREPILRRAVNVEQSTLGIVRQGMWRAVNTGRGTAHAAQRGTIRMAGKTGTAQPSRPRPPAPATLPGWDPAVAHAWFVGWAPWDRPQIVVVVLVEHGGGGGAVAAPIARKIVDGYFARRPARGAARQR